MDPCNLTNSRMYFDASFAVRLPKKTDRKTKQWLSSASTAAPNKKNLKYFKVFIEMKCGVNQAQTFFVKKLLGKSY